MIKPYAESCDHLRDELGRLDLLLERAVHVARRLRPDEDEEDLRGLVITDGEVDALMRDGVAGARWSPKVVQSPEIRAIEQQLVARRRAIDECVELSLQEGRELRLQQLAARFDLSGAEVDVVLFALAPELETRYEPLFAYLQDDATRKRPSIALGLDLFCQTEDERAAARELFTSQSRLLRHRLVSLGEETGDRLPTRLRRFVKLAGSVVDFLLGGASPSAHVDLPALAELELDPEIRDPVANLVRWLHQHPGRGAHIQWTGPDPRTLAEVARAVAATAGQSPLEAAFPAAFEDGEAFAEALRDARMWNAPLMVTAPVDAEHSPRLEQARVDEYVAAGGLVSWLGDCKLRLHAPPGAAAFWLEVPAPGFEARTRSWECALNGSARAAEVARLADTFRFGRQEIHRTVDLAGSLAVLRDAASTEPSLQDVLEAGRVLTTPNLKQFAVRIEPRYGWSDLILPRERKAQLQGLAGRMRQRHRVHQDWGFGRKLSRGKGLNALFAGPSGTGKTMAAEVLAHELSLDLFQIDLSAVVSKYVGETEKHLSAIFAEGQESQALLFFDEADALFGKRTEVKDAHDRYANIEINYLLQRIEQFEGLVVLATNLQRNLDEALIRRMHEVVEFPFPDEEQRLGIWRKLFPSEAPRAADIDFEFLARQFKLSGGHIKNVVLAAAFQAAEDETPIDMEHVLLGVKSEMHKLGRLCVKADFGPYYDLVHARVPGGVEAEQSCSDGFESSGGS